MPHKLLVLSFLLIFSGLAKAQEIIPTKGKEFWFGFMENDGGDASSSALNIFIASDQDTEGTVEVPGQGYSQNFSVQANVVTTVSIPVAIGKHTSNEMIDNKAIHILSEDTISVYAINFQSLSADGSKILPIQSLGTEYRIMSYPGLIFFGTAYGSEFLIVAIEDGTEIEITPSAATANGNPAGVPFTIQLNQGQSYQVISDSDADFTGTYIKGTEASGECRPFAVFSGAKCTYVPENCVACDHLFDQNFPVNTWGLDFFIVPFEFSTGYTYKVLANEDNTTVNINGGATITLNSGEFAEYNNVSIAQCISADKPICVTQFMQGVNCSVNGDPAMCILNDESQKIDNITFSTVESSIITNHALNIIVSTAEVGSVFLNGSAIDPSEFVPFPDCSSQSYAQLPIPAGMHTLEAEDGFSAYVYGLGFAESYAYSVGSFSSEPLEFENVTCSSDTVVLTSESEIANISWYAESDPDVILGYGPTLVLTPPIIGGNYVAVGNQFQSGCSIEEFYSVEVPVPPTLTLTQSATEICQYQSVQLNVEVDPPLEYYLYTWTPTAGLDNPSIANPIATPSETTTYSVLVSTPSGCGSNTGSLTIDVEGGNITTFEASASSQDGCSTDSTQLSVNIQKSIFTDSFDPDFDNSLWDEIQNGSVDTGCGSESGNALWFNGNGNRYATTVPLDISQGGTVNFSLKIGATAFPCDNADFGENVVLEYSTTGDAGPFTVIETFTEALYPNFVGLSVDVPVAAQTVATNFRWRQVANSGNNQDNWAIDNIYIGSSDISEYSFVWSPDYTLSSTTSINPSANPIIDTIYYVDMVDNSNGCIYSDSIQVYGNQGFELNLPNDTTVCTAGPIPLFATPDISGNYSWSWTGDGLNNSSIESPIANPTQTTTYSVVVESLGGCTAEGEITVTVNQLLNLNVEASDTIVCAGEPIDLNADVSGSVGSLEYLWQPSEGLDNANIQNPVATIDGEATYHLTITDTQTGCTADESIDLESLMSLDLDAGSDEVLCTVEGFNLNASTNSMDDLDWEWNNASLLNDPNIPNPVLTANQSAVFEVTVTNAAGCSETDSISLSLFYETIDLGPDINICEGQSVELSSGLDDSVTHLWSTNAGTNSIEVDQSGLYSLNVTSPEGCDFNDSVEVIVNGLPIVNLGTAPLLCEGDSYVLDAENNGSDFLWSNSQQSQTISVNQSGLYSVLVTDANGCESEDSILLEFSPDPVIDIITSDTICSNELGIFNAGNSGSVFNWSNGENTQSVSVNTPGDYTVTVTNSFGCSSSAQTSLVVNEEPEFDLGPDLTLCYGESITLTGKSGNYNHLWNTGAASGSIEVSNPGRYFLSLSTEFCEYTDSIKVTFDSPARNYLPSEIEFCFEECDRDLILHAGNPGYIYDWGGRGTEESLSIAEPGIYYLNVKSPNGCEMEFSTEVRLRCGNKLYIPNAFSPNGDGINDNFQVVGGDTQVEEFQLKIWNRWGEEVYHSENKDEYWRGDVNNEDYYGQSSVYTYYLKYKYYYGCYADEPQWVEKNGSITLIR